MGKLADLLSQIEGAKAAIKQQAADFSQGFNSGAVAGFPGWAGDMAYMADTARLALSGEREQAPPSEYVGTTDYIASKAGYPIPGSVAGQLGAAVGGMLSPGPGDLGRLTGVLSAIPFWHGSPHKFDRFDLSEVGTGEGAQVYGWGAYGADARDVADQYRINLAYNPDEMRIGGKQINDYYSEIENRAARLPPQKAASEYDKLAVVERLMEHATLGDAEKYADEVGVGDWFRKEVAPSYSTFGNLYRGEYVWPDPAKEAATPLTGEDLLQWDRPLSEQPESVRRLLSGVREKYVQPNTEIYMTRNGGRIDPLDPIHSYAQQINLLGFDNYISSLEQRLSDRRASFGDAHPLTRAAASVLEKAKALSGDEFLQVKDVIGRTDADTKADELYKSLEQSLGSDAKASEFLQSLGIPGIRYLDGMSRAGGSGTYNYVMFDDSGIKLLERNGNPITQLLPSSQNSMR